MSRRTCCDTVLQRICLSTVLTCALSRNCSAMPVSAQLRFIRTLPEIACAMCTKNSTRGLDRLTCGPNFLPFKRELELHCVVSLFAAVGLGTSHRYHRCRDNYCFGPRLETELRR